MSIIKIKENFIIAPHIDVPSFSNDPKLLNMVQTEMRILESTLDELDIVTFLRDAYTLGQGSFKAIMDAKRMGKDYIEIHNNQVNWLINYFNFLREIRKNDILYPYCPVLNQHPLKVENEGLIGREDLIKACIPERKKDISSSYGEGIGVLLLENLENVSPFGVLKISNGNISTPDFIVIDKYKKVSMLTEVKSSIHDRPSNPKPQLSKWNNISGLGIQVQFNSGKSPVEIILSDPDFTLEGSFIPSIYTNVTLLESIFDLEYKDIVKVKNPEWAHEVIHSFHSLLDTGHWGKLTYMNIQDMIEGDYISTGINIVDGFLDLYFHYQEDGSNGYEKVFMIN